MYKYNFTIARKVDRLLLPIAKFFHKGLGLTPNNLSLISFIVGSAAVILVLFQKVEIALVILLISLIFDGLDGIVARLYNLESNRGEKLELFFDRTNEVMIFLALVAKGYIELRLAILAILAILLMTTLRKRAKFDPGFKRSILFPGYFVGFALAFKVIFWVNLLGFIINMLILDYSRQRKLDAKSTQ